MKKQMLSMMLLSGLVLSVGAVTASAADQTNVNQDAEETKVEVKLFEDDGNNPGKGPFKDRLAIVWKPNAFTFAGTATNAKTDLINNNPKKGTQVVTVNDDRETITPWELSAKLSNLTSSGGNLASVMTITTNEKLYHYDMGDPVKDAAGNLELERVPVDHENHQEIAGGATVSLTDSIRLDAGGSKMPVIKKTDSTALTNGNGVTGYVGDSKLTIADGVAAAAGTYEGVIEWTLEATD